MEPVLGSVSELEQLPRLGREQPGRLGRAAVGASAAAPAALGAVGSDRLEPGSESLGLLERPRVDAGLTGRRI